MDRTFTPTRFLGLFRARLSRQIALLVFLSIVAVEALVLIPSVYRREQELLEDLQHSAVSMMFGSLAQPDLTGTPQQIFTQLQTLIQDPRILGGVLYQRNGQVIGRFGEGPALSYEQVVQNENASRYDRINHEYSAAWPTPLFQDQYIFIVRYNAQSVRAEILGFIARIVGLVVIISVFVTIATLIVIHSLVIIPILALRNDLLKTADIALPDRASVSLNFDSLAIQRNDDELGEVMTAFGQMHSQISEAIAQRQQIEMELRLSEEKFSKAFRSSPDPVIISRVGDGQLMEVNDSFLHLFGISLNSIEAGSFQEHDLWDTPTDRSAMIEALRRDGFFRNQECRFRTRSGEHKTVLYSAELIKIGDSECILAVIHDITARKAASVALKESEERFRTLIEQAADALFVVNLQGRFIDVNQQACHTLGYTREELLKLTVPEVEHALSADDFNQLWSELKLGTPMTIEGIHQRKDQTMIPVETRIGMFESGGERFILAMVRDITERKQAEQVRARLAEIGELAAMIVHEIRNPLTTVLMGLNYFKRQDLSAGAQARLDLAMEEAERLERLLNEILLYTKKQRLDLTTLDLNAFIADILESIQAMPIAADRPVHVTPSASAVFVQGDRDKLRQVFINLVSNACEAIAPGESVAWRIEPAPQNRRVVIQVHNGGEPIPAEVLPKLTQPFFTTKSSGNGLGLAITKRIVEAHGGTFKIESSAEAGTTVTLELPLYLETPSRAGAESIAP